MCLQYVEPASDNIKILKGHRLPLTCAVVTNDSQFIYSGSKDCSIIKCKLCLLCRHVVMFEAVNIYKVPP